MEAARCDLIPEIIARKEDNALCIIYRFEAQEEGMSDIFQA